MAKTKEPKKKARIGVWKHKEHGTGFEAKYKKVTMDDGKIERSFVLSGSNSKGRKINRSYDSHEAAKKDGWSRSA